MIDDEIGALDEPQKRLTTVHSRFQVGCVSCGFVEAYSDRASALVQATNHYHGDETSVFDSMARRGKTRLWQFNGNAWAGERR
jgi:hypothetical protein